MIDLAPEQGEVALAHRRDCLTWLGEILIEIEAAPRLRKNGVVFLERNLGGGERCGRCG